MKEKILGIEDSAMEEWRRGNPMKWVEISAEEVVYIDPGLNAPIVGREAYVRYLEPLKGKVLYDGSEYVRPRVAVFGKTAVLTYNYHSLRGDKDGVNQRTSFWNTTEVYRRIGEEWKIVHTHWSYIGHDLPESLEMTVPVLGGNAGPLGKDEAEIMRLETGALERWRKGDPGGFLEISADEVTYFDAGTPSRLNGLAELKKEYEELTGKIRYDVMEIVNPRLTLYGDSAVLFYQHLSTILNADGTVKSRTPWNCTEVYARIGGAWMIVHTHWSYIMGRREGGGI